jgi:hypothetical protein
MAENRISLVYLELSELEGFLEATKMFSFKLQQDKLKYINPSSLHSKSRDLNQQTFKKISMRLIEGIKSVLEQL